MSKRRKRYSRLLQLVAVEALGVGEQPFQNRLRDVLELIMEAMDAQVAVLLLFDSEACTLITAASAGIANVVLEEYASTLDPLSFAGQVATHEEPTVLDVFTTELQVNAALERNGIHSLLGVRLPPRHRLMGVLYIGLSNTRAFSPSEIRLIETLAYRLALHLDNAKLYADLQDKVDALTARGRSGSCACGIHFRNKNLNENGCHRSLTQSYLLLPRAANAGTRTS